MPETHEKLSMPLAELHAERSLPVPVAPPRPRLSRLTDPTTRARYDHDATAPGVAFLFAVLSALLAGASAPVAGLGVLALGLLGAVIIDLLIWRRHEEQLAITA
ncbi:MAG: hypothetical protein WAS21_01625 [Geminicoccaceae bacterium]